MQKDEKIAVGKAILAAALFGISAPFSKILLEEIPAALMAALLYLGAGIGMSFVQGAAYLYKKEPLEAKLVRKDLPYTVAMVLLDVLAPVFLMLGLSTTSAASVSLLNNFEIVATALIAGIFFREPLGKRMWGAIAVITAASMLLSFEDVSKLSFSLGSIFVLLACLCWGMENNCTRMLSLKNPLEIVIIKGFGSGFGALLLFLFIENREGIPYLTGFSSVYYCIAAMLLGFVAYGLSIFFYISAQRYLGAARTSAYYAVAPFIGVALSIAFFSEHLPQRFWVAVLLMIVGTYLTTVEKHTHIHKHQTMGHTHKHTHTDGHHNHVHEGDGELVHSHYHMHEAMEHTHKHKPDMHHRHAHEC
ncbi:DMT family transporter [Sinanaerobacter sp. ZZT-01]|uniref:DMT family transporter n=1 Tax=Sinanaerobacter sp. ZZT-01 TaxID=3111540 RepID=UPI002D77C533|nr:EamA family transporter [Sinanaerobacter sp. ZZT-01]WRR94679.1 EamA family transporter [Sinanaerobacter sp. ZZT-01]